MAEINVCTNCMGTGYTPDDKTPDCIRILEVEEIKTMGWAKTKASKVHPVFDFAINSNQSG